MTTHGSGLSHRASDATKLKYNFLGQGYQVALSVVKKMANMEKEVSTNRCIYIVLQGDTRNNDALLWALRVYGISKVER
jgi:hypothetical protein